MAKRDYYELLEVERTATQAEVKVAFRKKALEFHPDRNPDNPEAEETFKLCSEAYEVLSDDEKRRTYDQFGHEGLSGRGYSGFGDVQDVFSHFQDIFGDMFGMGGFGRRPRRDAPARGADVRARMEVSLAEAAFGVKKELPLGHASPCTECHGTGAEGGELSTCATCGGRGQVAHQRGGFLLSTTCPSCRGQGSRAKTPCGACQGSGEVHQDRKVEVSVPAGIDEGQTLRLSGLGQAGRLGGPAGDLYVSVMVQPDARFERERDDLYYDLHVSYPQAALGAKVVVPSLEPAPEGEGELTFDVVVPAGIQPGELVRVSNGGVPRLGQRGRGDLVCVVQVDVPRELSPRAQELIRELAASFQD